MAKEEIRKSNSELHLAKVALKEEQEINKGVCHRFYNDFVESSPPPFCPKLKTFNGNEKFNQKLLKSFVKKLEMQKYEKKKRIKRKLKEKEKEQDEKRIETEPERKAQKRT